MFKVGDKVRFRKGQIPFWEINIGEGTYVKARTYKFLTVRRINFSSNNTIEFNEVRCYWKTIWFISANAQLEFDFNA